MLSLWQDLRYGSRLLLKSPGFTLVAVLTLALGIGANTAIFSVVEALILRPLPYQQPERLVMLSVKPPQGNRSNISYPNFSDWRDRATSFESMASVRGESFNLTGVDKPIQLRGRTVNWNFFNVLGVSPQLGRAFSPEDDRYGAGRTVMISHRLWQWRFGGDSAVIGSKILLDSVPYEVIGVLRPGFEYFRADDLYVPIGLFLVPKTALTDRGSSLGLHAVARLKPGTSVEQASNEIGRIAAQLEREYPDVNAGIGGQAEPLQDVMSENVRQSLWVLLCAVGFILLIACVNVANLMLVRATERQKEISVRLALGAGRWRIVRQLLSESLVIALLGGGLGILLGSWMLDGLLDLAPSEIPLLGRVSLDVSVLLFTLSVALMTSIICGLLPALQASRIDLNAVLKSGARAAIGGPGNLTRKILTVVEVSLALVLLIGAGLLVRSMAQVLGVDSGFDSHNLLTMRVNLNSRSYSAQREGDFYNACRERLEALPGVRSAALTVSLPIDGSYWDALFFAADKPVPQISEMPETAMVPVTTGYFQTMGIRLLKGREFTSADTAAAPRVAVINETMARTIWPNEDPIGKRFRHGYPQYQSSWREVIGVVADVKLEGVEKNTPMQSYLPLAQEPWANVCIVVRTTDDPQLLAAAVEQSIHELDRDLPVSSIRSMHQLMRNSIAQRRLTMALLTSFAVLALLLAAVGIYGVLSYTVRQRNREMGIRMALGAQVGDVLRMILAQGLKLTLIGVAAGLVASFVLTRWMESLLFEVRPTDPLTFVLIASLLTVVAALACWIPARVAGRVDPMVVLRCE